MSSDSTLKKKKKEPTTEEVINEHVKIMKDPEHIYTSEIIGMLVRGEVEVITVNGKEYELEKEVKWPAGVPNPGVYKDHSPRADEPTKEKRIESAKKTKERQTSQEHHDTFEHHRRTGKFPTKEKESQDNEASKDTSNLSAKPQDTKGKELTIDTKKVSEGLIDLYKSGDISAALPIMDLIFNSEVPNPKPEQPSVDKQDGKEEWRSSCCGEDWEIEECFHCGSGIKVCKGCGDEVYPPEDLSKGSPTLKKEDSDTMGDE